MPGFLDNTRYTDLVNQVVDIYLRDMPEIMLLEELHVVVYNEKYWKGWSGGEVHMQPPIHVGRLGI